VAEEKQCLKLLTSDFECSGQLEEASIHKSANTLTGNVFVTRDLAL